MCIKIMALALKVIGSIAVIADSPSVKQSTQPVTITVTALGSSIRPASTDVRITAGTAAQQTTTMLRTVTAMEAGERMRTLRPTLTRTPETMSF